MTRSPRAATHLPYACVRRVLVILFAVPILAVPGAAVAQEGVRADVERAADDILHVWTSPLRMGTSDLALLIGAAEAVLLTGAFDEQIQRWLEEHPESLPVRALGPLRQPAPLSYLGRSIVLLPLSGLLYGAGLALDSDPLRDAGIGCVTANVATTVVRHTMGRLTGRQRPMYGDDPYDFDPLAWSAWGRRSFPGGHGSNIMACASFWSHRFDLGPAEPLLYAFAMALGAARTTTGAHWASDTVFGSMFGWAVGRAIAGRFSERDADAEQARPTPSERQPGFTIGWRIPVP